MRNIYLLRGGFLLLFLLKLFDVIAQEEPVQSRAWTLSFNAGTMGAGLGIQKRIAKHWGLRSGIFGGNFNQQVGTVFNGDQVLLDARIKLQTIPLLVDFFPGKSAFKFSFGVSYHTNRYTVDITPKENQSYGFVQYTPEQVGKIIIDITGANLVPYLGLGFGRTSPKHRLGMGLDLGAFYHGVPKTNLICTGTFEPSNTAGNREIVAKAFNTIQWYPFINFNLTVRLSK